MTAIIPNEPLWQPSRKLIEHSNLKQYCDWLFVKKGLYFRDYEELWRWSVTDTEDFWETIWHYFNLKKTDSYINVLNLPGTDFIGAEWFTRSTLNYSEHIFRNKTTQRPALLFQSENQPLTSVSWQTLEKQVAALAAWLRNQGIQPGDRVAGVLPNSPHAVVAFLATNAIGAVWSCCSPDFGNIAVIDRFKQIEPKVLLTVDGYTYNGRRFHKTADLPLLKKAIPSIRHAILIPYLDPKSTSAEAHSWETVLKTPAGPLEFEPLPFSHPLWILYSSGTTGKPKAIVHSNGGCLLEHLKALTFHQDVKPGENYFWFSTTGWMMWNYALASLLTGATLVVYDGSPSYPDLNVLWQLAESANIHHFGGGAAYFNSCMKAADQLAPVTLNTLRSIGSTGAPLSPETFTWLYTHRKNDVWLISLSGGTDVCSAFVGGCPMLPVYAGEIQCRMLGASVQVYNESGKQLANETGEMVLTKPMPSMPVYFWNDPYNKRYHDSYFTKFPDVWTHGDWVKVTPHGSVIIYGRSDATLNRQGVRIGPADIYYAVDNFPQIKDSLVVYLENQDRIYLFLVMKAAEILTDELQQQLKQTLRNQYSPRHVPDVIHQAPELPYTKSGKKMEAPVKRILMGMGADAAASKEAMQNPQSLRFFEKMAASITT